MENALSLYMRKAIETVKGYKFRSISRAAVISILSSVIFSNALFQKISTLILRHNFVRPI